MSLGASSLGERVDKAIVSALRDAGHEVSRSLLEKAFAVGQVRAQGHALRPSAKVESPMQVDVVVPRRAPLRAEPEPVPLTVLFEDESVLVIDKPAGIVVHPSAGHPGGTLVNGVLHHLGLRADGLPVLPGNDETRPGVVHRLDKNTSGVMVFTKTPKAAASLASQFQTHAIERRYVGILNGAPPLGAQTVETTHVRDPSDRKRFAPDPRGRGRRAVTHMTVIESWAQAAMAHFTLETGRTHQIRMHARHVGTPIFGDDLYGSVPRDEPRRSLWRGLGRHALHAEILGFDHPERGERVRFVSNLSPELCELLTQLRPQG